VPAFGLASAWLERIEYLTGILSPLKRGVGQNRRTPQYQLQLSSLSGELSLLLSVAGCQVAVAHDECITSILVLWLHKLGL